MAKISKNNGSSGGNGDGGGAQPPAKRNDWGFTEITEPRCSICKSDVRREVDRALAIGMSSAKVAEFFERAGFSFTRKAVWNHGKRHMTLHTTAIRNIIERRAKDRMADIEEVEGFLLSREALIEIATNQGYLAMMAEEMEWTPRDLLAWTEKLEAMEREDYDASLAQLQGQFDALIMAIKSVVPLEQWELIYERWEAFLDQQKPRMPELVVGEITVEPNDITEE